MASASDVTYPPLDTLKPLAENVWLVDSGPIRAMGLSLPVRMTVVRLASGGMWLHSPTRFDEDLRREIEAIGPIQHLVAPNIAHWSFLKEWQEHCPGATTSAAPHLRERAQVKAAGVRLDRDLGETPPADWAGEIGQAVVPGALGFREVAFFHRPSRTLVLTDLVENLETARLPLGTKLFALVMGANRGTSPAQIRLALRLRRREAAEAVRRILAWAPERVIFAHGRVFERDGTRELKRAMAWLVG
ncbi:DUF4336 domain-containing protein [Enterovirga aerilata]|uniref:DUF4336 domain-containing protein n=1 Tax=Enterovirga aerilata TaxID=2730920 RepID=A0A849HZI2_9HYPH|nr:DUF4336 domain-containing protein [Enterovirga sp. DB1703]NNM72502.1 DUF4336 domain-containing protein [Enterovirga sp. DB1703]